MSENPCQATLVLGAPLAACKEDLGHPGPHVGFIDGCRDDRTGKPVSGEVRWWTP